MPLAVRRHSGDAVSAWLWGLLPDDDRVLRRWAERFEVRARSPFDLLGTPVGRDCAGAVSFVGAAGADGTGAAGDDVTWRWPRRPARSSTWAATWCRAWSTP